MIDFVISIYINDIDGIYEIFEDSTLQNILMIIIACILLLLCLIISNVTYKGITYDALIKEQLEKNKKVEQGTWDKFKSFLQNLQNKVDHSIPKDKIKNHLGLENSLELESQINRLLKKTNLQDFKIWLKKQNRTNNKEIKKFVNLLLKKIEIEEKKRAVK